MSITQEQLIDALSNMTVMEIAALRDALEEKWGVSAAAPVAMAMPAGGAVAAAPVEEQTEFTVVMESFGAKKIGVIKVIREITGLGLKEAKDLVEGVPATVKEGVPKAEAADIKAKLEAEGATVKVK
ncbi:MAG: 50S ribosomal protein L7/L12 [Myxococcota bacterium]|jgi:large subunit ribosomal protein L7/L12|nr:50S ribosomal protein L7/L12 [Myxococcota bacterium]